jgi:hypothetical protein
MKTYIDRLRECPIEMLKNKIKRQEAEVKIAQHDLETMMGVMEERTSNDKKNKSLTSIEYKSLTRTE